MSRLRDSLSSHSLTSGAGSSSDSLPITATIDTTATLTPLLALCDSTVTLAEQALASCAARVRAGDSLLAATNARLAHQQRKPGARRFPVLTLGTFVTTEGTVKLGIGVGVRIW